MDYEKKYNEALERARKIHSEIVNNELIGFPAQIEDIFPELRESEDERIRKELINYHTLLAEKFKYDDMDRHKVWLAWLEEQKEQTPVEWSEEDEEALREVKLNFELNHEDMTPALVDFYERFFRKVETIRPQPKQEWSEEDKKTINMAIETLEHEKYPVLAERLKSFRSRTKSSNN